MTAHDTYSSGQGDRAGGGWRRLTSPVALFAEAGVLLVAGFLLAFWYAPTDSLHHGLQPEDLLLPRAHRRVGPGRLRHRVRGRRALSAPAGREVRSPRRRCRPPRPALQRDGHGHRHDLGQGGLGRVVGLGAAPHDVPHRLRAVRRLLRAALVDRGPVAARHLLRRVRHHRVRRCADHVLRHPLPARRPASGPHHQSGSGMAAPCC